MLHLLSAIDGKVTTTQHRRNYSIAIVVACGATVATQALMDPAGFAISFIVGLAAVIASAWLGGIGPALIASAMLILFGNLVAAASSSSADRNLVVAILCCILVPVAGGYAVRNYRRYDALKRQSAQRERYLQTIFENVPAAIMLIDRNGSIMAVNEAGVRMFSMGAVDPRTWSLADLIELPQARPDRQSTVGERLRELAGRQATVIGHPVNGAPLHLAVAVTPFWREKPHLTTLCLRDETAAHAAADTIADTQANLAQISRAAALGTMGSAIAHELNQPLAAATNYASAAHAYLARRPDTPPQALAAINATIAQVKRAGEILTSLRTFIRPGPPTAQWLDLADVVREAAQLGHIVLNDAHATLVTRIEPDVSCVWADRVQIQQVLVNLLNNAAEAVSDRALRFVTITAQRVDDDEVQLCVSDTGPGVSQAVRKRLFELFNTSKKLGLGVGLAISKTIVEAHGGKIWCDEGVEGARFCLTLKHSAIRKGQYGEHKADHLCDR